MGRRVVTVEKGFRVETRNLLFLPRGYRRDRRYPLVTAVHGMGMTAEGFARQIRTLRDLPVLLFVPEGVHPFEIRAGGETRIGHAWYLYTGDEEAFVASMRRSGGHLRTLLDRVAEEHAVDRTRQALLGFSQGGYFAGYFGIRHARLFRGLAVIGARVKDEVLGPELARGSDLPVLLQHGRKDRAVPFELAERSRDALDRAGWDVTLRSYDCGHHVTAEQLRDLRSWLRDILRTRA